MPHHDTLQDLRHRQAEVTAQLPLVTGPATGTADLEAALRAVVADAVATTGMTRGAINLLDATHQHSIAAVGFTGGSVARDQSICSDITGRVPNIYSFADLDDEPGFAGNPWVDGRHARIRAYASAPVIVDGTVIGTLCVVNDAPHELSLSQCDALARSAIDATAMIAGARQRAD